MSLEADAIAARRALRRKVTFWRVAASVIFVGAIAALGLSSGGQGGAFNDHIARIRIEGLITGDTKTLELIEELEDEARVKAVIVRIDSPGGTTAGSEAVYEALSALQKKKPVVAVMDTVAASGGYIAALPADHIVARGNTITGSIGVIFSWPDMSKLLDTLGVKMEEIKSGELKAAPSPYAPLTPEVRDVTQAMVTDGYDWFTGLVAERRKLTQNEVRKLADGRVYSGRQALAVKLIDQLGGEREGLAWLQTNRNMTQGLDVVDYDPAKPSLADDFGLSSLIPGLIQKVLIPERLSLDGLQSVWHP